MNLGYKSNGTFMLFEERLKILENTSWIFYLKSLNKNLKMCEHRVWWNHGHFKGPSQSAASYFIFSVEEKYRAAEFQGGEQNVHTFFQDFFLWS